MEKVEVAKNKSTTEILPEFGFLSSEFLYNSIELNF